MKEFVEYIVHKIVKNKDAVTVTEHIDGKNIEIRINVSPEDMGIVIGKGGNIIKSIRALVRAKAIKDGVRVSIELTEP